MHIVSKRCTYEYQYYVFGFSHSRKLLQDIRNVRKITHYYENYLKRNFLNFLHL